MLTVYGVELFGLVWNDFKNQLIKGDVVFKEQLEIVKNLNKEEFNENMISKNSYVKAYGKNTYELKVKIEKEIAEKFNQTSDTLEELEWDDKKIILYSMLYRNFEYNRKFDNLENDDFEKKYSNIKYFGIDRKTDSLAREQIKVLFYKSQDEFAISICTKSNEEVIFYKNPMGKSFNEIYNNMIKNAQNYKENKKFSNKDEFKAPKLNINEQKRYEELENKEIIGTDFEIDKAIQTIKFSLDENGGEIKSEAAMPVTYSASSSRLFYIDDTFALFIKEKDKKMPYLAARIDDITKFQ